MVSPPPPASLLPPIKFIHSELTTALTHSTHVGHEHLPQSLGGAVQRQGEAHGGRVVGERSDLLRGHAHGADGALARREPKEALVRQAAQLTPASIQSVSQSVSQPVD